MNIIKQEKQLFGEILHLSLPIILMQVINYLSVFSTIVMVGRLGLVPLAASGLGYSLYLVLLLFGIGFQFGSGIPIARAIGANKIEKACETLIQTLWVAVLMGVLSGIILYHASIIFHLFKQNPHIVKMAETYLRPLAPLPGFAFAASAIRQLLLSMKKIRVLNIIAIGMLALTLAIAPALIFGFHHHAGLGLAGASLAVSISGFMGLLSMAIYCLSIPSISSHLHIRACQPKIAEILALMRMGFPIASMLVLEILMMYVLVIMIGRIHAQALAAYQAVSQITTLVYMIPYSVNQALCLVASKAIGAKQSRHLGRIGWSGAAISLIGVLGFSLLYWLVPQRILHVFFAPPTDKQQPRHHAARLPNAGHLCVHPTV